jgi:REP element-mobilizing transposase RayT
MAFLPYDPQAETHVHRQKLPHWRQWGSTYFVTTRLADSMPAAVAVEWRRKRDAWLLSHGLQRTDPLDKLSEADRHEYHRNFTAGFHELLDAGSGECHLAKPVCADILTTRLTAGHGKAYRLDAWCIMPNHLHALVEPLEPNTLGEIVRHWKGGSAHDINITLDRKGPLWQQEPFDHIVRSEAQLEHFRRYIAENPRKAGLKSGYVLGMGGEQRGLM